MRTIGIIASSANMSNIDYNENGDHPSDQTIADLMYACGVSVTMDYSDAGSVSFTLLVANALINKFKYGYAITKLGIAVDFYDVLEDDMKKGRPAQLGIQQLGQPGDEGHSIVCDGYRDDDTWHLNFGWGDPWWDPVNNEWVYIQDAWYDLPKRMPAGYNVVFCGVLNIDKSIWVPDFYPDIQTAINNAVTRNVITVRKGTYTGPNNKNLDFGGRAITVEGEGCPAVTIIDCENSGRGFYFHSGEGPNSIVDGLTITNGGGTGVTLGGGILCEGSSPSIMNCIITANLAKTGGGIHLRMGSDAVIDNCLISDNTATPGSGAGIYCYESEPVINSCAIEDNSTTQYGGGVYCSNMTVPLKSPSFNLCRVEGNTAQSGGGFYIREYSSIVINDCLITGNKTTVGAGGGILCGSNGTGTSPTITNCTISGNTAKTLGGAVGSAACFTTITDCIMWGNDPEEVWADSLVTVTYCDIQDGTGELWFGTGCIDADPLFVHGPLSDYYLSQTAAGQPANSPCVDVGSGTAAGLGMANFTTRTDRVTDSGTVDMGYHADPNALYIDTITVVGSDVLIQWNAKPDTSYCVHWSPDMVNWTHVSVGETNSWTHVGAAGTNKYYGVCEA